MSDVKFVIGIKNSEPAPPEFVYFCDPKPPVNSLSACVVESEVVWDADPDCAEVFRSTPAVADALGCLMKLFPHDTLFADILKGLGADEIEYLQDNGVLDLTNVT